MTQEPRRKMGILTLYEQMFLVRKLSKAFFTQGEDQISKSFNLFKNNCSFLSLFIQEN
jgi:hypothetical protein